MNRLNTVFLGIIAAVVVAAAGVWAYSSSRGPSTEEAIRDLQESAARAAAASD